MITIDRLKVYHNYTPEEAERIAKKLQADDPEWLYKIVLQNDGRAIIEVYDEEGLYIDRF